MTQPSRASLVLVAREGLADILEVPVEQIHEDADLKGELDVDSLQQLELAVVLEERFGIVLDADDLSEINSIDQMAERALRKLRGRDEPTAH